MGHLYENINPFVHWDKLYRTFPFRPSIISPIHTLCSCSAKLALRWCDDSHDVRLRLPLWELKQSPTWEITVTNSDKADSSLPLNLFPSSVSLYSLHPSLASPTSKICIQFKDALLAWQITVPCCQGKTLLTLYLSLQPYHSFSFPPMRI